MNQNANTWNILYPDDARRTIISDALQRCVAEVDPNGLHCLVENKPKESGVEFCHVLKMEDMNIESIEWFWKMKRGSLTMNTPSNVFCVGPILRVLYEKHCWALLPPPEIVARYSSSLTSEFNFAPQIPFPHRETFPQLPDGVYEYRLMPLCKLEGLHITRQTDATASNAAESLTYSYPFDTFPVLRSHIHPKFAILALGRSLIYRLHEVDDIYYGTPLAPLLLDVLALYRAWTNPSYGLDELMDTASSYAPASQFADDGDDEREVEDGGSTAALVNATEFNEFGEVWPEGGLSRNMLAEHEDKAGTGGWTRETLANWARQCD